jgi:hypothetical protein
LQGEARSARHCFSWDRPGVPTRLRHAPDGDEALGRLRGDLVKVGRKLMNAPH